jgi:hypothetical protein
MCGFVNFSKYNISLTNVLNTAVMLQACYACWMRLDIVVVVVFLLQLVMQTHWCSAEVMSCLVNFLMYDFISKICWLSNPLSRARLSMCTPLIRLNAAGETFVSCCLKDQIKQMRLAQMIVTGCFAVDLVFV